MYNEKILEYFNNPKNGGDIKGADGVGKAINKKYGDIVKMFVRVNEEKVVEDASFKTTGSVVTIALCQAVTEYIKGNSIDTLPNITIDKIISLVDGIPESKTYCAILVRDTLMDMVNNYNKRLEIKDKE